MDATSLTRRTLPYFSVLLTLLAFTPYPSNATSSFEHLHPLVHSGSAVHSVNPGTFHKASVINITKVFSVANPQEPSLFEEVPAVLSVEEDNSIADETVAKEDDNVRFFRAPTGLASLTIQPTLKKVRPFPSP